MAITKEQLKIISNNKVSDKTIDKYLLFLNNYMNKFAINTNMRISAFIANLLHESGNFYYTKELASGKAYEGRKDLGNTEVGDGVKYKGRGLIQITGRLNYKALSSKLDADFINHPELLETPEYAVASAC